MKVMVEGEVQYERESTAMVKLNSGFGEQIIPVLKERLIERSVVCSWCGHKTPLEEASPQAMTEHISKCANHPMAKMAVAMIVMADALEAADHDLTVRQGCVMDFEKDAPTGPNECKMSDAETLKKIDNALKVCGRRKP